MVDVAQSVRVTDCGSEGRGFESHLPPSNAETLGDFQAFFLCLYVCVQAYRLTQKNLEIDDWYDCAIVNSVNATIDGGEYGKLYTYEHAKTTIKGEVNINTLTTATITNGGGYLKIDGGTIEKIVVVPVGAKYPPTIVVNAGATVKEIDFSGSATTNFVNNSGKEITIVNAATTE